MNEWTFSGGIWSLKAPTGMTLIQIRHDGEEYVVAKHNGERLGKSWDEAKAAAVAIVNKPTETVKSRKGKR